MLQLSNITTVSMGGRNMREELSRTEILIGNDALFSLNNAKVAVFGIGGVGGYAVEALVRGGVGSFVLIDNDTICASNINRQIIAAANTIGRYKTEVMKERILNINPNAYVETYECFFLPENSGKFNFSEYDYVVDAVDTITAKLEIIIKAKEAGVPVISSMGTGNKLDAGAFVVTDIYKTSVCPLARVMRRELKKRGIEDLKVVYSTEKARTPDNSDNSKKAVPGSMSYVPPVAGLILAGEVIKDIAGLGECTYE